MTKEQNSKPTAEELEQINRFTRRTLGEDEVYVFSVVLCDNEIDRDGERFSEEALEKLSELFVGVTGIADHNPLSENQTARIFTCRTETVEGKLTGDGKPYKQLLARAYLPRSEQSQELILDLDSGIKKEVSVGCSVKKRRCSVCGKEFSVCEHRKGKSYGGKTCFVTLDEPVDAYEWSFVAVPAQKAAGVVKTFWAGGRRQGGNMELKQKLMSKQEESFSPEELSILEKRLDELEQQALDGAYYRSVLTKEIGSLALLALPGIKGELLTKMVEGLSVKELDALKTVLTNKAHEVLPLKPQLIKQETRKTGSNTFYQNI